MYNIFSFPSLVKINNADLSNAAGSLINGLKIRVDDQWYICGNLAVNEDDCAHKVINSSPEDIIYQTLFKAALLLAGNVLTNPVNLTIGFPNSTYKLFRQRAVDKLTGSHEIVYDSSVYRSGVVETIRFDIVDVEVIPEIIGCTIAVRRGATGFQGKCFVLSCGFGTFETVLSTEDGVIEHTMHSAQGLKYAIDIALAELEKRFYLSFKDAHVIDEAFKKGYIILERKKIDLTELRKYAINRYYNEVISPLLRTVINDSNLMKTNEIFICGGGLNYTDLADCFKNEFEGIANLHFVEHPEDAAVKGYFLNSLRKSNGHPLSPVGLDIGNASTRICAPVNELPSA